MRGSETELLIGEKIVGSLILLEPDEYEFFQDFGHCWKKTDWPVVFGESGVLGRF